LDPEKGEKRGLWNLRDRTQGQEQNWSLISFRHGLKKSSKNSLGGFNRKWSKAETIMGHRGVGEETFIQPAKQEMEGKV